MRPLVFAVLVLAALGLAPARAAEPPSGQWFEQLKATATPEQLYRFLYALPKGGDLHNHLSGGVRSEWMWTAALAQEAHGYTYYTKVRIDNCAAYGSNEYGPNPYLLLFVNLQQSSYDQLDDCRKSEFKRLQTLTPVEQAAWLDSIRLDQPYEGRNEFFGHWNRLHDLWRNPWLTADILLRDMQAFGQEGVVYLELQDAPLGYLRPDGSSYGPDEPLQIIRARFATPEALATGVTVRFQATVLRFAPKAEETTRAMYAYVASHRDLYVGVNFVGREDDDKGYPLRFLDTLRALRRQYPGVHLSIHAGEVDEPNHHVRDTLLLGAERIGHGVNLITDPDTMLLMRNGPYLVEINLISNLFLEYVQNFQQHPFPEYLRTGIPVALSTDDRGMWDSNLSDEYFVAVREFNLSWDEIVQLGRNSLQYAFVEPTVKQKLLADYETRVQRFAGAFQKQSWAALKDVRPVSYSFTCRHYQLCLPQD